MGKRSKEQENFNKQTMTDFMRILMPEIEPSLKANKFPVTHETKLAFMVGVEVMQRLRSELLNQRLMDLGYDPALVASLKFNSKHSGGF